jgi:hypothetical protein
MKRIGPSFVSVLLVVTLLFGMVTAAMAGKPQGVIEKSNGFPSGKHFNLNVHGKWFDYTCNPTPGGNSVFVCQYGEQKIEYVSNKRSSLTELLVLDRCSDCFDNAPDPDPVSVMLPYKIQLDTGEVVPAGGFWVFGRILGTPNNGKNCTDPDPDGKCPSSIIWDANVVKQACNDDGTDGFGDYTDCDEVALGVIVGNNLYTPDPDAGVYTRFDPQETKGKGNSKATDMTPLFTYEGWVSWGQCPETDGIIGITKEDISADFDIDLNEDSIVDLKDWILYHPDTNCDGIIDEKDASYFATNGPTDQTDLDSDEDVDTDDWYLFQETLGHSSYYPDTWIFDIADLVYTEQGFVNDGTKLFQIRFYPKSTTEFVTK